MVGTTVILGSSHPNYTASWIFLKNVSIGYILNLKYAFQPVNEEEKQSEIMKLR